MRRFRTSRSQVSRRYHLVRRGLLYSLALVLLILVLGGVGFWLIDPRVNSLADGLWLAFTTAATVGYGDLVPSTHASRAFSVLVVLLGLAVLSLVTASLAAIFVEQEVESEERQLASAILSELAELRIEVAELRAELAAGLSSAHGPETPEEPSRPASR
jgi:voltage-gated potassium channel